MDLSAIAEKEALALANSKRNEIKEIRNHKQLEKVDLDFDSPRMKQALYNLGVSKEECMKKYYYQLLTFLERELSSKERVRTMTCLICASSTTRTASSTHLIASSMRDAASS